MKRIGLTEKVIKQLDEKKLLEVRNQYQMNMINSYIPKPTTKTSFEGFRTDKTDALYYDDFLPNSRYREYALNKHREPSGDEDEWWSYEDSYIAEVTPQEYIDLCYKWVFDKPSPKIENMVNPEMALFKEDAIRCRRLANAIEDGVDMYLPFIDFRKMQQEGRHRAGAAYILGIETIPVLILK